MEQIKTTKAIRFKLESNDDNSLIKDSIDNLNNHNEFDLEDFVERLNDFIDDCNDFLFCSKKKNGKYIFFINNKLIVKNEWLKLYAKHDFSELKKNNKAQRVQYTIGDIEDLSLRIQDLVDEIENIYNGLLGDATAELHERAKRAQTALLLKRLYALNSLPCLVSLINNIVDKNEKGNKSLKLKSAGDKLLKQLEIGIQEYLPEQSSGVSLTKASFNYYTINKKPIDFDRKIEELSGRLKTSVDEWKRKYSFNKALWELILVKAQNKPLLLGDSPFAEPDTYSSLRQILKNIMARQKAEFSEMMQDGTSYKELKKSDLFLFNDIGEDEYQRYFDLTEEIENVATDINQCSDDNKKKRLRSQLNALKKKRGALIDAADKSTKNVFKTYKVFAAFYRVVSQKHGKILAQLKGIEKERTESQLLQYWAMILEENNRHKLVLIPKDKAKECKERLTKSSDKSNNVKLYWFESFTFRSLQKLCFGNIENGSNTFYPELKRDRELYGKYHTEDMNGYPKFISGEHEFKGDEQRKIQFYKDVLSTRYAQSVLSFPVNEVKKNVIEREFESLDDFKIALEQVCYQRYVNVDIHFINALKDYFKAQVLDITSYDLRNEINTKDKETVYSHTDKTHTEIWKQFWTEENEKNNFDIRLNPEISITYRKAKESRVAKYGEGSDRYDSNKNNRYLHDQLTLVATFSEHSNSPAKNMSFTTDEEMEAMIKVFNSNLNREKFRFAFGIDNGEVEISTLGVYLPEFDKPTNEEVVAELKNVEKYGFKVLTIKNLHYSENDYNGKERRIIQNPSYFMNRELYCRSFKKTEAEYEKMFVEVFEEKHLLTLDLSTAKVINGHIVTNGDVVSLFNLWMRHAQRNIYEMNDHTDKETAKNITLKRSENLTDIEKRKFLDYLNVKNEKYKKLSDDEKTKYIKWVYEVWKGNYVKNDLFDEIGKKQRVGNYLYNVLLAETFIGEELKSVVDIFDIRNVFKFREDFYSLKSEAEILEEISKYNVKSISLEEVDLRFNDIKSALVANVVGVVDFLYKQYKTRFGGEGIIAKEGFDSKKVESDREKFSGNIYRLLERKLYQKFQNYGLVPPIKNLMSLRKDDLKKENEFMQLGNICFVGYEGTSQSCPVCEKGRLGHTEVCPKHCGFESTGIMHSNDGIAGYNIAKRGFNNIVKK